MKRLRPFVFVFLALVSIPVISLGLGSGTAHNQIAITITLQVTPAPMAVRSSPLLPAVGEGIVTSLRIDKDEPLPPFRAQNLAFDTTRLMLAQVGTPQAGVRIEASVSPNPIGTQLTQSCPPASTVCNGSNVIIPITAGTTVTVLCAYEVQISTAQTSWTLNGGLFSDFETTAPAAAIPGGDMLYGAHYTTPSPAPVWTPFAVLSDNGDVWQQIGVGAAGIRTYCVDLKVTVPSSYAGGWYTSNALYEIVY